MRTLLLGHLRSNAIAYVALFIALGGTSYAAIKLPKNSVGTKQLKKSAVTRAKIGKNAVDSSKVAPGSLLASDFRAGQLQAGPKGDKGDPGPKGDPGLATGAAGGALSGSYPDPGLADGVVGSSKFATLPGATATAYGGSAQSIPSGSETAIAFEAEARDTDGILALVTSSTRFTIKTTGTYLLEGSLSFASNSTNRRTAFFRVNGAGYRGLVSQQAVQGDSTWMQITRIEHLAAGDYVELFGYQNSGTALNTDDYAGIAPEMSVQWIGP